MQSSMRRWLVSVCIITGGILNLLKAQNHLQKLQLEIEPNFQNHSIQVNLEQFWIINQPTDTLKLKFYPDFEITLLKVNHQYSEYKFSKTDSLLLIPSKTLSTLSLEISFNGKPKQTEEAPWESGFVWAKSNGELDWLTLVCQNESSALWWPSPIIYSDKPDTTLITCIYDANLFFKGNGRLIEDTTFNDKRKTTWKTTYPINTYNITLNIGDYSHWSDTMISKTGKPLSLDFYPLKQNLKASKIQFKQVKPMINCYESAFGPYPYINDGYSVVETPYAGMEHQSSIAYGNGYTNGYNGKDYSGLGLDFDFILIHESGHEWWGNSISGLNKIDFWLQEAFCTYAELIYVDCLYGYETAVKYINLKKRLIENKGAILSDKDSGSDMYMKGALMLNTLSNFLSSKEQWRTILKDFYTEFEFQSIESATLFNWFSERIEKCNTEFFFQYLSLSSPPILEFNSLNKGDSSLITLKVMNGIDNFTLPVVLLNEDMNETTVWVTNKLKTVELPGKNFRIDESKSYFLFNE